MSEYLPYDEIKFDKNVKLEDILNIPDHSNLGYFIEVDFKISRLYKRKIENFSICSRK